MLSTKNLKTTRPYKKLNNKFHGLFMVKRQLGKQAYVLDLPQQYWVHPVFHVSLLKPAPPNMRTIEPLPPVMITEDRDKHEEYEVEAILASKFTHRKLKYQVKWKGYSDTTWEPAEIIQNDVPDMVQVFHRNNLFTARP